MSKAQINEAIKNLVIERSEILHSLDSRISRHNEKANTNKLVGVTGFNRFEVNAIYSSEYCDYVVRIGHL